MVDPDSPTRHKVVALYKFVRIPELELDSLQSEVDKVLRSAKARGTILLAKEGINGTICYPEVHDRDEILDFLNNHPQFHGLRTRISYVDNAIFHRLKVKKKKEIVTIGGTGDGSDENDEKPVGFMEKCTIDPTTIVGTYVKPGKEWDDLLDDPDVVVIDTRNKYEIDIGTFENAVSPNTDNFRQFPDWLHRFAKACKEADKKSDEEQLPESKVGQCVFNNKAVDDKKEGVFSDARTLEPVSKECMPIVKRKPKAVAMFCTGGIRCEKSTSYTIAAGVFPSDVPVYHLDGGVLAYLDAHPDENKSKWHGECFVFDQRVAVTHGLKPSSMYNACHACRRPISVDDMKRSDYVKGISCRYCVGQATEKQKIRFEERQKQIERALPNDPHIHDPRYEKEK